MKASPWEKEDAMHEGIPIHNYLVPKAFTHEGGKLTGVMFEKVEAKKDAKGRRQLVPTGEPDVHFPCDDVLVAIGQENAFPWIERDLGVEFDEHGHAGRRQGRRCSRRAPGVFFGGDAAFGPEEHHLGGRARPRRRDLDRSPVPRRGPREAAAAA